eukprot:COSAG06_NODE_14461_length_1139_cov_4.925118_2_plen_106_part_00
MYPQPDLECRRAYVSTDAEDAEEEEEETEEEEQEEEEEEEEEEEAEDAEKEDECCGFRGHRRKSQRELDKEKEVAGGAERFVTESSSNYTLYSPATRAWASSWNN